MAGGNDGGTGNTQLNEPTGIFFHKGNKNLYIADSKNSRIQRYSFNSTNGFTIIHRGRSNTTDPILPFRPTAIFIDRHAVIHITDQNRIKKFVPNAVGRGVGDTWHEGTGLNRLNSTFGIHIDQHDNVYVSEPQLNHVLKLLANTTQGRIVAGTTNHRGNESDELNSPAGIHVFENGDLLVSDAGNHRIQKFKRGSEEGTTVAGSGRCSNDTNDLCKPEYVLADGEGNVYVSDAQNNRIQRWKSGSNKGETIAGGMRTEE